MPPATENIAHVVVIVSAIILLLIAFIFFILVIYHRRRSKLLEQQDELKKEFAGTLLQTRLEIQEQTLLRVSHELHDNIGQVASIIKINLNTIRLDDAAKAESKLEDSRQLMRQLITDIKSLSVSLGSDRLNEMGLVKAIQTEVSRINRTEEFNACFEMEGNIVEVSRETSLILFRMVQEMLNNSIKHSGASEINVKMRFTANLLTLAVSDNGSGFEVNESNDHGAGLANLRYRAELIKAKLDIRSDKEIGTRISVEMSL